MMKAPRRAFAPNWVKPQPDPLRWVVTVLRGLEPVAPAEAPVRTPPHLATSLAVRHAGGLIRPPRTRR